MQQILVWALVFFCGGLFTICDSLSANWGKTGDWKSIILVFLISPITYLFFGLLNQKMDLGIAGALVNLIIVVGTVLVGVFYFQEVLTNIQLFGVFLACFAIVLLST
jgi:multidrug transporter EmrE-like cation transporter